MFLTQIVNGQVTELAFCEECAKAKGLFDPQSLSFAENFFPEQFKEKLDNLMRELSGSAPKDRAQLPLASPNMLTECPACHFTLADFRRTERLGCPVCYEVFAQEIAGDQPFPPVDAGDQRPDAAGGSPAPGTSPAKTPSVLQLKAELQQAIEREDYEKAAQLRDQIRKLS